MNKSHSKIVSILTNQFSDEKTNNISLTKNLDYLINNYSFKKLEKAYSIKNKKIYLYNTHNLEKYNDGTSINDVSLTLKNNLIKLGIDVIYEETKFNELLHTGLTYYNISRLFLNKMMNENNDINYYIDIHRDSALNTSVTIDNKKYAKILFVLGLDNINYQNNKKVISKMNDYLNNNYPGISRGIYEKNGSDVNGVYNQDLNENVLLIEIGGVKNNLEELNNSTEIIALMLYHMLGD